MSQQNSSNPRFDSLLRKLFGKPSIVLIGGTWKTGKTDFSLYLAENLLRLGLVREVASNINTKAHFPQISDLISLRQWLYSSNQNKLYIFDEASEHLPSTRAVSGKSVGVKAIIPQVSKAHGRMLVVGHNLLRVDSQLLDATWCKGIFFKISLHKTTIISNLLQQPYTIDSIPGTTIGFDPYDLAPFTEKPGNGIYFKDEDKQLIWRWANGETYESLGIYRMTLHRKLKEFCKNVLQAQVTSNTLKVMDTPKPDTLLKS